MQVKDDSENKLDVPVLLSPPFGTSTCTVRYHDGTVANIPYERFLLERELGRLPKKLVKRPKRGWDSAIRRTPNISALPLAARQGDLAGIRALLDRGVPVNGTDSKGRNALRQAVDSGRLRTIELLLERGADVNARSRHGWTSLYIAVLRGWVEIIPTLLKHHADPNLRTLPGPMSTDGDSPLAIAVGRGNQELARVLLKHGADPDPMAGVRPLELAAMQRNVAVTELLLNAGCDVNARFANEWTLLHYAASNGNAAFVQFLLSRGADPNARTSNGITPMHLAVLWNRAKIFVALLAGGAQINAATNAGDTTQQMATGEIKEFIERQRDYAPEKTGPS